MDWRPVPIGSQVELRLVHIFEMREAKIAKETSFEMWKGRVSEPLLISLP
jgi:hypothetical protein